MDKPKVEVQSTYRKTVSLDLSEEQVASIISEWLIRNVPQFRGTDLHVNLSCGDYEGCRFSCTATGVKEKRS